jgi:hypothetical protein
MKFKRKRKIVQSVYSNRPGYVREGTTRLRTKFCWLPVVGDKYIYWLENVVVEEIARHRLRRHAYSLPEFEEYYVEWQFRRVHEETI